MASDITEAMAYQQGWDASKRPGHDLEKAEDRFMGKHGYSLWRFWIAGWMDYSCDQPFGTTFPAVRSTQPPTT